MIYIIIEKDLKICEYIRLMKKWALTLKYNTNPNPSRLDYMEHISKMLYANDKILIYNWAFESDSQMKLHLHMTLIGSIKSQKGFFNYFIKNGFAIDLKCLKKQEDYDRWENYLNKQRLDVHECEQVQCIREMQLLDYPFITA